MEFEQRKKKSPPGPCSPFLSGAAQSVSLGFKPCAVPLQCFKMNKHKIKNETKARVAWLMQGGALGGILGCFFCHHFSKRSGSSLYLGLQKWKFHIGCTFLSTWDSCRVLIWKDGGGKKIRDCSVRKSRPELSFLLESSLFNH